MPGESPLADPEDESDLLRPSWQDTPDETDADRHGTWRPRPAIVPAPLPGPDAWLSGAALAGLLVPLCAATDALARLDARAAAAPADAVRDGLRARMAPPPRPPAGSPTPGSTRSISRFARPASPPTPRWLRSVTVPVAHHALSHATCTDPG